MGGTRKNVAEPRRFPRRALVLSPAASHPLDYGNRNRVFQTAQFLKDSGFEVHFVLYPIEEDWTRGIPPAAQDMRAHWDSFHVIIPTRPLHQLAAGDYHTIDEWWDPAIGDYLKWLFERQFFDVVFVNYVYLSKAFEFASKRNLKVLDTHDVFSGRREMLAAGGVAPEFFYTTWDQEQIGFNRADIIIAIKDSEQALMSEKTTRDVVTLTFFPTYLSEQARRPAIPDPEGVLRVGFIGAQNSVNTVNMAGFLRHFERLERWYSPPLRLVVAGSVCRQLHSESPSVRLLGRVRDVEEFYDQVDVVMAPMRFSTGLKIKVGEALGFGKAVVATENAYDGFPVMDEYHSLPDFEAMGQALIHLAYDRDRLARLQERSSLAASLAARRTERSLRMLSARIASRRGHILFVTDTSFWTARSMRDARLHQWAELCTFLQRTTALVLGEAAAATKVAPPMAYDLFPVIADDLAAGLREVRGLIADLAATTGTLELVVSLPGLTMAQLLATPLPANVQLWLDLWPARAAEYAWVRHGVPWCDVATVATGSLSALHTTALRYLPDMFVKRFREPQGSHVLTALCGATAADLAAAELFAALAPAGTELHTIDCGPADAGETRLARVLDEHGRPALVVGFGRDRRTLSLLRAICGYGGVSFAAFSPDSLPRLWRDAEGVTRVHTTYPNMMRAIWLNTGGNPAVAQEASDTGWSSFWHLASGRFSH